MFVWLIFGLLAAILVLHYQYKRSMPPGPFSLPIVGSIPFMKKRIPAWFKDQDFWAFGDMVTLMMGNIPFIVINDFKMTKDLFTRDEFSGRMKTWWHQNVRGYKGRNLGIINTDGQVWTEQRRFALKQLRDLGFGRNSLDSVMCEEADDILNRLIETAAKDKDSVVKIESTFNTSIINVLWQIVASTRFDPDSPKTKEVMDCLNEPFKVGFNFTSHIPGLKRIMPWNSVDRAFFYQKSLMRDLIKEHVVDVDYDNPRDFIDVYLTEIRNSGNGPSNFDIENLVVVCLDFFQAGAETTSTTLLWSVLFMAVNPKVQEKCQEEIDRVLGSRNPAISDMSQLVYVMATIMEIQRLSCTAPGSLPHRLSEDAQVNGYSFSKGTIFMCNLTKFLRDPDVFTNPDQFNVDRFLTDDGKSIRKYDQFAPFGIGKRICMGESLAKNEMFLFFVKILQRVSFSVPTSEYPLPDPEAYNAGITLIPDPFFATLKPRNT